LFGYLDELTVINLIAVQKVITDIEEESSLVTDEFHDVLPATLIPLDATAHLKNVLRHWKKWLVIYSRH